MKNYGIDLRKHINDISKEIFRKSIHICAAFIPPFLYICKNLILILLFCVICLYVVCEFLRLKGKTIPIISAITQAAARSRDKNHFVLGPVTLAVGILITALIFPPEISSIGIYSLAFGDGLASLSGKLFGKQKIPFTHGKTVVGSLTCFVAIFIVTFLCQKNCFFAFIIALVGMMIELFPLKDFDNLLIPIILSALAKVLLLFPQIIFM